MKTTISRHEQQLTNRAFALNRLREEIDAMTERYIHLRKCWSFYEAQIQQAKQQGKDGFDEEFFMKKERSRLFPKE